MVAKPGKGTLLGHVRPITHATSEIDIPILSGSTNVSLEDFMTLKMSAGRFTGGIVSDVGSGNARVAEGTGMIRISNSPTAKLVSINWPTVTLAIPTNSTRHVFVEYNSGTPRAVLSSTDDPNLHDEFPLASIVRESDTTLHLENDPEDINNAIGHILRRFYRTRPLERDERTGGLILGESGDANRFITMSGGALFERVNRFPVTDKDTDTGGAADTFSTYFTTAPGVHTRTDSVTAWPFEQYNDGSGLVTMTNNRFAVLWFYIEEDDNLLMQYGTAQYAVEANAETETEPSDQPARITEHAKLIGRLIFRKSTTPAIAVESAFGASFVGSVVTDHGNLAGLGDSADHTWALLLDGTRNLSGNWIIDDDVVVTYGDASDGASLDFDSVTGNLELNRISGDADFQINMPIKVGVDDTGHDVQFFGATAGDYFLWDESAGTLRLQGDSSASSILQFNTAGASVNGNIFYNNGASFNTKHLEINSTTDVFMNPTGRTRFGGGGAVIIDDIDFGFGTGGIGSSVGDFFIEYRAATSNLVFQSSFGLGFASNSFVFNEDSRDVDFRIEGGTLTELFMLDAGNDILTIGGNSSAARFNVVQSDNKNDTVAMSIEQLDVDATFIDYIGTSAADGSRSISSDTTEDGAKFGAFRVKINGVTKWVRVYDDHS